MVEKGGRRMNHQCAHTDTQIHANILTYRMREREGRRRREGEEGGSGRR